MLAHVLQHIWCSHTSSPTFATTSSTCKITDSERLKLLIEQQCYIVAFVYRLNQKVPCIIEQPKLLETGMVEGQGRRCHRPQWEGMRRRLLYDSAAQEQTWEKHKAHSTPCTLSLVILGLRRTLCRDSEDSHDRGSAWHRGKFASKSGGKNRRFWRRISRQPALWCKVVSTAFNIFVPQTLHPQLINPHQ